MTTKVMHANGPDQDAIREEILGTFRDLQNWSAHKKRLLARGANGWLVYVERPEEGLVSFTARNGHARWTFWMNASSVSGLRAELERQSSRRWQWPGDARALSIVLGVGGA